MAVSAPPRPARPAARSDLATQHAPPLDLPFRFIATAMAWLALMAVVYPWHTPLLLGSFYDPHLITFVHVNTLGLIASTILGASYQLLPVVLQVPITSVRLGRVSWWLYVPGLIAFVLGMSGGVLPLLGIGGTLLYLAVGLYVYVIARTLLRVTDRDVIFWHITAAVVGLGTAATLGALLALSKGHGWLGGLTFPILGAHVALMIGGWVTPMLAGVAYRLVGMFTLSEDQIKTDWAYAELVLVVAGAWILAASLLFGLGGTVGLVGSLLLLAGLGFFAAQLVRLYQRRRRKTFDVHIPFALTSATFGLLALLLAAFGFATGRGISDPLWIAAGWWAIAGWAETAIQGFLYKIGTFLTWLHRYAPLAGRQRVPRLEELYGRRTAIAGWISWTAGVAVVGIATLLRSEPVVLVGAGALSVGAVLFLVNVARVGAHWRARPAQPGSVPTPARSSGQALS